MEFKKVVLFAVSILAVNAMGRSNQDASSGQLTNNQKLQHDTSVRTTWMPDNGNGTFTDPFFLD